MSKSTTSSVFPDVNVWLALSTPGHEHFSVAWNWYQSLESNAILHFCRITQLGLLRLLTTQSVMGRETLTQAEAWRAYDRWLVDADAKFVAEPTALNESFRRRTQASQASPKEWSDAYLAAFAETASLTLVTFDRALAARAPGVVFLSAV
jgi:hypothetical protein